MLGLLLRSPQRLATSSGSMILNSPDVPSQVMTSLLAGSASSSSRNCHSWIWPDPGAESREDRGPSTSYGSGERRIIKQGVGAREHASKTEFLTKLDEFVFFTCVSEAEEMIGRPHWHHRGQVGFPPYPSAHCPLTPTHRPPKACRRHTGSRTPYWGRFTKRTTNPRSIKINNELFCNLQSPKIHLDSDNNELFRNTNKYICDY